MMIVMIITMIMMYRMGKENCENPAKLSCTMLDTALADITVNDAVMEEVKGQYN